MTEGEKERAKLSANYFNGLAIAVMAIGGFAPLVAVVANNWTSPVILLVGVVLGCFGLSAVLHFIARRFLGGIQ